MVSPAFGSSEASTSESITGMWRAGPPAAGEFLPRPAIIPVLPLARRFRGAPRRVTCEGRVLSDAPPRDDVSKRFGSHI